MSTATHKELMKQGAHPDPLDPRQPPPDVTWWPERQRRAWCGRTIENFRAGLRFGQVPDVRAGVLDDLSAYFGLDPADCVQRCINWEQWSVEEWQAGRRDSADALADFYRNLQSWAFDLLWYAYLQAEGYAYPVSVVIAETLPWPGAGRRHLDFGSGIGATSQLFGRLGFESDLADISTSLLSFARFRLERRGQEAAYLDLNDANPSESRYDVITAIDTLVHVPDLGATARLLHRALKPGGLLYANFDVRPRTAENAWHLYEDDLPLRWQLQRVGFEPEESLDGMITRYRRVEPGSLAHHARGVRDAVLLRSPLRPAYRATRDAVKRVRGPRVSV
jgi:SAM-dependent methyltransferase